MPFLKLHNISSYTPVGSTEFHYGYTCEVREDGVYADIPDALVELEMSSGRVRAVKVVEQEVVTSPEVPEPPTVPSEPDPIPEPAVDIKEEAIKEETAPEVTEPAKRMGRPPKSK